MGCQFSTTGTARGSCKGRDLVTSSLFTLALSVLEGKRGKTLARETVVVLLSARWVDPGSWQGWSVGELGVGRGCSGGLCQGERVQPVDSGDDAHHLKSFGLKPIILIVVIFKSVVN